MSKHKKGENRKDPVLKVGRNLSDASASSSIAESEKELSWFIRFLSRLWFKAGSQTVFVASSLLCVIAGALVVTPNMQFKPASLSALLGIGIVVIYWGFLLRTTSYKPIRIILLLISLLLALSSLFALSVNNPQAGILCMTAGLAALTPFWFGISSLTNLLISSVGLIISQVFGSVLGVYSQYSEEIRWETGTLGLFTAFIGASALALQYSAQSKSENISRSRTVTKKDGKVLKRPGLFSIGLSLILMFAPGSIFALASLGFIPIPFMLVFFLMPTANKIMTSFYEQSVEDSILASRARRLFVVSQIFTCLVGLLSGLA